jgi:ribosomal protein S7
MSHGKKSLAYKIVYQTMESIAEKHNKIHWS